MAKKAEPNRTKDASCFVRMSTDDRERFEEAIERLLEDVPGAKMGVGAFLIEAGRRWSGEILGKK